MHPFVRACLEANRTIAHRIGQGLSDAQRHKSTVGAGGDISSGIDLEAEAVFVRYLAPFGQILSEESGTIGEGKATVILDPIDGSSNLLSNFPYYGTSAALVDSDGTTVAACVCNLAAGKFFFVTADAPPQYGALFSEDFMPYRHIGRPEIGIFERAYAHPDIVRLLGEAGLKFRAPGAVALSLVYARQARFFLFVGEYRAYDFAAGKAFLDGMKLSITDARVIAAQDEMIFEQIASLF